MVTLHMKRRACRSLPMLKKIGFSFPDDATSQYASVFFTRYEEKRPLYVPPIAFCPMWAWFAIFKAATVAILPVEVIIPRGAYCGDACPKVATASGDLASFSNGHLPVLPLSAVRQVFCGVACDSLACYCLSPPGGVLEAGIRIKFPGAAPPVPHRSCRGKAQALRDRCVTVLVYPAFCYNHAIF